LASSGTAGGSPCRRTPSSSPAPDGASTAVTSVEVARRHPDGRWLYAIDDPFILTQALAGTAENG
jgi:hypothetical protein